jgi:hypothetical protein
MSVRINEELYFVNSIHIAAIPGKEWALPLKRKAQLYIGSCIAIYPNAITFLT